MLPAAIRRWLYKPKKSDPHPLAQFYYADKEVTRVMIELNNMNLHIDPQEYVFQLNNLRAKQDHMLQIINQIMDECIPSERPNREFQVKFPDEVLQDQLGVQLWFAAECLMAGSLSEVHESEVFLLRPLAEDLLRSLEEVRSLLREQSFTDHTEYTDDIKVSLIRFDRLFAEFEYSYVSAVVPIKSPEELFNQQQIIVLFCETIDRALKLGYLTQEMIDGLEPVLMFTIPRLAIICGLMIYPEGPLNLEQQPNDMSKLFKPFYALLQKIRDLLHVLTDEELSMLEKSLCAVESEDVFNPDMFPNLSTPLQNNISPHEMLDEPTHASGVSPIQPGEEKLNHPAHNEPYCYQSTLHASNSVEQTPNEIQHLLEGSSFIVDRGYEMWGQEFRWIVNVNTEEDAQTQKKVIFTNDSTSSSSTSSDSLTDSNSMQFCSNQHLHSETDHPEFLDSHEVVATSTMSTIQASSSPGDCQVLTPSKQDHVSHFLNADCPDDHTENHKLGAASFLGASPERNNFTRNISNTPVPEDPHMSNSRLPEGENEPRVVDWEVEREAVQAMKTLLREEIRSRYQNSSDMLHRLFVCISGVADQLQTNFAGDLRRILKTVFEIVTSAPESNEDHMEEEKEEEQANTEPSMEDCALCQEPHSHSSRTSNLSITKPEVSPEWIADSACNQCMSCKAPFTILRRRHHCRNCGKIFCSRCSSQTAPLPWYGQMKPVRVCSHCYMFHLTSYYSNTSTC